MSLLIKGPKMPMPERCWDCRFMDLQTGKCYADGSVRGTAKGYKRPADCPLFPGTDHGNLVDRDEFIRSLQSWALLIAMGHGDDDEWVKCIGEVCDHLYDAPIIIPAERSKE